MTLAGLRPGEKLYEEKLMAEEGMKKTDNDLICIYAVPDRGHVSGTVLSGYPETGLLHRIYQDSQACIDGHAAVCPVSLCNTAGSQLFQINVVLYRIFVFML